MITNSLYPGQTQRLVGSDFDLSMTDRVQEIERVFSVGLCINYYRLAAYTNLYPWQIDGPTQKIVYNNPVCT